MKEYAKILYKIFKNQRRLQLRDQCCALKMQQKELDIEIQNVYIYIYIKVLYDTLNS